MSTPAIAPDEQTLSDYRAIREGRAQPKTETPPATPAEEKKPAAAEEKPAAAAAETPESEETEESGKPVDKEARKSERLNERFSKITRERDEALRQLTEERSRLGPGPPQEASKPAETPAVIADPKDPEPDAAKYTDYLQWQKEWTRWDRRQEQRTQAAEDAKRKTAEDAKQRASAWQDKVLTARVKHGDYDEVALAQNLPVTQTMAQAITDTEVGTEILYHLGQNPLEAARIAKLQPIAQVREIGKLEAKLAAEPSEEKAPDPKPVSQAPKPVKALAGAAAASTAAKNLEGMTQAEYRAYRESGKIH